MSMTAVVVVGGASSALEEGTDMMTSLNATAPSPLEASSAGL